MRSSIRWKCESYRGMYIHVVAFEVSTVPIPLRPPWPKWDYVMAVRYTADRDDRMFCESFDQADDYFTREAAEQAAFHYGRFAVDIIQGLG